MWQYRILETGNFYADGGAMFGVIPKTSWSRKYPSDERNTCRMAMRCLLAWNGQRVILMDTGVGNKDLRKLNYYRFHDLKNIADLIRESGFQPEQVTDIVLSHLHFDHCGGCSYLDEDDKLTITFPNALHWTGRKQWEIYAHPNQKNISFRRSDMMPVAEAGLVRQVDSAFELAEGFHVNIFKGHTYGQLASYIETDEGLCVFPGDIIPTQAHLPDAWISAYDTHPLFSEKAKQRLKKEIENKNARLVFYHDAYHPSLIFHSIKK
jgi:glyoxylase-like metal-dependent hydrolase (beta-lactamase superfamily II)